ncbi:hypothetical protein [Acidithiobacillus ferrivorans]|uniref:Uncharacterized protein n=1 Tax=Acidithiobacillus ferrivorans TaxID=160808 RepID=A0A7T4WE79_9PROT|nr:hypothetical protein [Acidithiobacillus ferrivorans]QQD72987.1 hypothetical protein H2515_01205 [Acidithiobacillus ferrivorans]
MFFAQGPVSGIPAGHPMRTLAAHAKARRSVQPDPAASRLAGVQVVAAALNALGNHSALSPGMNQAIVPMTTTTDPTQTPQHKQT